MSSFQIDRAESKLEYADESSDHMSYFEAYAEPSVPEQAAPDTGGRGGLTQGVN